MQMDGIRRMLLELIRAALHGTLVGAYDKECEYLTFAKLLSKHQLLPLLWPVMEEQAAPEWKHLAEILKARYQKAIRKGILQQIEIEEYLELLEKKGIDCLPLKGWYMREYYSDPLLRSMTDFDVLIRAYDEENMPSWMKEIGYEPEILNNPNHDVYVKSPLVIETHKRLADESIVRDAPLIADWLSHAWERCVPVEGKKHIFRWREEDFYLYHLIHAYKHIISAGVGLRPLIDIYLFLESAQERLDWEYIYQELQAMHLEQYESVMRSLCKKCFAKEEEKLTTEEEKVLDFCIDSGLFGHLASYGAIQTARVKADTFEKKRFSALIRLLFPPYHSMQKKYQILKKYPALLPFCWVCRFFRVIFKENGKLEMLENINSKEKIESYDEIFRILLLTK